jgi:SH3-like domain-containing protein
MANRLGISIKRMVHFSILALILISIFLPTNVFARDELKNSDPEKYYIVLDLNNQYVTVYEKDQNGKYEKIVRRFLCSSGKSGTGEVDPETGEKDIGMPTPTGIWRIGGREWFGKFADFGGVYARYWTQIVGDNYFHSIMFDKRDVNTMESSAFNNLGKKQSHGCVRLYVEDAKWLYYYACPGTLINVTDQIKVTSETRAINKALKISGFKEYNAFQKRIFDTPELSNKKAWVVVDKAAVKKGSASKFGTVTTLKKDDEVEVLIESDPWVKVKANGKEGYIMLAHITYEQGAIQSKPDADIVSPETKWIYDKILEKDDKEAKHRIIKVPFDSSVKVLEVSGEWTKIDYFGHEGWLRSKFLKKGWGTIRE